MASRQSSQSPLVEWLNNPWKTVIGAFISIVAIFTVGYTCAVHFCNQDFKIEKIEIKQDYGEKIQNAINACRDGKIDKYQEDIDEIKETVKNLKKTK